MSLHYNPKGGYLDKDDLIKALAHDVERLEKELRECRHIKDTYRNDVLKVMDENIRLRNCLHGQAQMMRGPFATWHDPKEGKQP